MNFESFLKGTTAVVTAGMLLSFSASAQAQDADGEALEEITVTGSRIRRSTFDIPAPVEVINRSDIDAQGIPTITDLIKNMTINTGSQFNQDFSTQRQTAGTAQVNLRGLGLNSTLTLVNGRRTTLSAQATDDGSTFVDINQYPLMMVERIEVLKDGAAAIYGSDAVAGVFNIITRKNFQGLELDASYQTTTEDSQVDATVSVAFGVGNDTTHISAFFTYFDRTSLNGIERDFFPAFPASSTNTSGFGHIPTLIFNQGTPTTGPFAGSGVTGFVLDPDCGVENSIPAPFAAGADPATGAPGFCRTDFSPAFGLVAEETRHSGFTELTHDVTDNVHIFAEMSFSKNRANSTQASPPPVIREAILIRSDHPANPHGVDLVYFGRPAETELSKRPTENDYWRTVGGVTWDFDNGWYTELAYTFSSNNYSIKNTDVLLDSLTVESGNAAIPRAIRPDFNPFGSAFTGTGPANDPAILDEIIGVISTTAASSLTTVDWTVSGDVMEMPAGPVGVAFGGQWRQDMLRIDLDSTINRGLLGFEGSAPDTERQTRDVYAGFAEVSIPLAKNLELQAALRIEDYEGAAGSTTDPKLALLWRPNEMLTFRASGGTAFRAPSLFQANVGGQTALPVAFDPFSNNPAGGCSLPAPAIIFPASRTTGNPDLKPEDAENYNFGVVVQPAEGMSLSIDYWHFDTKDVIVKENLQQILNEDCADDGIANDPRITRGPGGVIRAVDTQFINAASLVTDGIDIAAEYAFTPSDFGQISTGVRATYLNKYSIQQTAGGPKTDGAGNRNFTNPFNSAPEWRVNFNLDWASGPHAAGAIVRYIDSFTDDNNGGQTIPSHTTVDFQYKFDFGKLFTNEGGTTFTVGAINVFDNDPPFAQGVQGFDSKVHDPRGRLVYFRIRQAL